MSRRHGYAEHEPDKASRVLVVDDDADVARFIEMNLTFEGFEVTIAHNAQEALTHINRNRPDLVLLDVMMPSVDGVELCRRLRANPITTSIAIIMLTAKGLSADKVVGLTSGADDYIVKPFDTLELIARIRSTLQRNQQMRDLSPLTGLPGNGRIMNEISERVDRQMAGGQDYAVCYIDLDNFKAINDAYGFLRGDQLLMLLAQVLLHCVAETTPTPFLGHIGGDDFVVICQPEQVQSVISQVIAEFEQESPTLYDPVDAERSYLEVPDRQGQVRRYTLPALSVGVAKSNHREFTDYREVVAVASEMKQFAKKTTGSVIAVDRRSAAESEHRHFDAPLDLNPEEYPDQTEPRP